MEAIICENNIKVIVNNIQEYLNKNVIVKGILLVDQNDQQVVILLDDSPIDKKMGEVWWSGFRSALQ